MESFRENNYPSDLRFALEVLNEYKHLGLDEEHTTKLRGILLRHIDDAEKTTRELVAAS